MTNHRITFAYDCRILSLLRRMPNLNKLTLCLYVVRLTAIDGVNLKKEILPYMLDVNTFIFHICTIMPTSQTNNFLTTNYIQNTFINWKYSSVNCFLDHASNGYTSSHIYSIPFKMTYLMQLTNSFRGYHFQFVIDLTLFDTRPFEHDFFHWLSQAFPLLKYLIIYNLIPQENKSHIEPVNDKQISSKISYLHLIRLRFAEAHTDYANEFLCDRNANIPHLHTLVIQYEKLVTVTNNFTNDST